MKLKAQTAIEFILVVVAVVVFFAVFLFALRGNISDQTEENINLAAKEIALIVQNEASLAAQSADGYRREFEIPSKIANLDYLINISTGEVYVRTVDGSYALSLPAQYVVGEVYNDRVNVLRKEGGKICLNVADDACAACGNGVYEPPFGETCDDANLLNRDGCSVCKRDPGWTCPFNGTSCRLTECADGVDNEGDGKCDWDGNCGLSHGASDDLEFVPLLDPPGSSGSGSSDIGFGPDLSDPECVDGGAFPRADDDNESIAGFQAPCPGDISCPT